MSDEDEMTFIEDEEAPALMDEPIDETIDKLATEAEEKAIAEAIEEEDMKVSGNQPDPEAAFAANAEAAKAAEEAAKDAPEPETHDGESWAAKFACPERSIAVIEKTVMDMKAYKYMYGTKIVRDGNVFSVTVAPDRAEEVEQWERWLKQYSATLHDVEYGYVE